MSKYFDSENFESFEEDIKSSQEPKAQYQPATDNNINHIKEKLSPNSAETHASKIKEDTEFVNKVVDNLENTITDRDKYNLNNTYEKFSGAEIFQKLNQVVFLLVELNTRIANVEEILAVNTNNITPLKPKLTPREQYESNEDVDNTDLFDISNVKEQLNNISKKIPKIPGEDYLDKSKNLEDIFPNAPEEAIQASYNSMRNIDDIVEGEKVIPKGMQNLNGF